MYKINFAKSIISTTDGQFVSDFGGQTITDSFILGQVTPNFLQTQNELQRKEEGIQTTTESRNLFGSYHGNGGNIMSFNDFSENEGLLQTFNGNSGSISGNLDVNGMETEGEEAITGQVEKGAGLLGELSVGSLVGGGILSTINSAETHYLGGSLETQVRQGMGPTQHNVLQDVTAQMQSNTMEMYSGIAAAAITAGSLIGPEGLAVGALAGAAIDTAGYFAASQQDAQVNTTSGVTTAA